MLLPKSLKVSPRILPWISITLNRLKHYYIYFRRLTSIKMKQEQPFFCIPDVLIYILTCFCYKIFRKFKNNKKQRKSKKYIFNIFVLFLAFSISSKNKFKFLKVFRTCSTFHSLFLKLLIFLIESTLILLVFKKYKK